MGIFDRIKNIAKGAVKRIQRVTKQARDKLSSVGRSRPRSKAERDYNSSELTGTGRDTAQPRGDRAEIDFTFRPFTADVVYDKSKNRHTDRKTGKILGKDEVDKRRQEWRKQLAVQIAKRQNPTMTTKQILKKLDQLADLRRKFEELRKQRDKGISRSKMQELLDIESELGDLERDLFS